MQLALIALIIISIYYFRLAYTSSKFLLSTNIFFFNLLTCYMASLLIPLPPYECMITIFYFSFKFYCANYCILESWFKMHYSRFLGVMYYRDSMSSFIFNIYCTTLTYYDRRAIHNSPAHLFSRSPNKASKYFTC